MSGSLAQDAIALLIDLANQGEIDPWDVQVIDVIDRYLSGLVPVHDASQVEREVALSRSGQAFLYASMLVLLKADNLVRSESLYDEQESPEEEQQLSGADGQNSQMPLKLEKQLRRRAVAPVAKKRRVTLQELIDQLQLMSQALEEHIPKRSSSNRARASNSHSKAAVRALSQLANQENLADVAKALDRFLTEQWHELTPDREWLEIDDLVERWKVSNYQGSLNGSKNGAAGKHYDRVGVFWALLLLSAESKVELSQEEFYQDLKIKSLSMSALNLQAI